MAKICFVNFNIYCLFNKEAPRTIGGAELDLYTVAKSLAAGGHEVRIVTADWGQGASEYYNNIPVYASLKLGSKDYLKALWRFWRALLKAKSDIYICSCKGPEVGIIALFCKIHGKKCFWRTASDMDVNPSLFPLSFWREKLFICGVHLANRIITINQAHRLDLQKNYGINSQKIRHINLALSVKDKPLSLEKKYILWVARCDPVKNPQLFLKLVGHFPNYRFVMICPKQNHNAGLFKQISDQAKQYKNLRFIDFVPFSEIQRCFNEARLFINTSSIEGFPLTIIQSGLGKTPVVYFNVNPDQVITKYNLGRFAEGDFSSLIESVRELMEQKKTWQESSEAIYNYVKKFHDIDMVKNQWEAVIKES